MTQSGLMDNEDICLLYCCEIEATSVVNCIKIKTPNGLKIPMLKKLPLFL